MKSISVLAINFGKLLLFLLSETILPLIKLGSKLNNFFDELNIISSFVCRGYILLLGCITISFK